MVDVSGLIVALTAFSTAYFSLLAAKQANKAKEEKRELCLLLCRLGLCVSCLVLNISIPPRSLLPLVTHMSDIHVFSPQEPSGLQRTEKP